MLTIENLRVNYGPVSALRGISLHVDKGEIVGLLGPNGAGKTTTLRAVAGAVRAASGDIQFNSRSIVRDTPERIVRQGISLVPENRHIFTRLSVRENLLLGATIRKDRSEVPADIASMVDRFPFMKRYLDSPAGTLSGGEQQQLAIARALLSRPSFLLLDEPSLGLAPIIVDRIFELIGELRSEGTTILVVEQVVQRTMEVADRVYLLQKGVMVAEGTGAEMDRAGYLESVYVGFASDAAKG